MSDLSAGRDDMSGRTSGRIAAANAAKQVKAERTRLAARALRAEGCGTTEIANRLGISGRHAARLAPPVAEPEPPEAQPAAAPGPSRVEAGHGRTRRITAPAPPPRTGHGRSGRFGAPSTVRMIHLDGDFRPIAGTRGSGGLGGDALVGDVDDQGRIKTGGVTVVMPRRSALDDYVEKKERAEQEAAEEALLQEAIDAAPEGTETVVVSWT
jgi:hypothetical protein